MTHKILVTTQMMLRNQSHFSNWLENSGFNAHFVNSSQFLSEAECLLLQADYVGWIAGDDEITEAVIKHLTPKLKVISKWGSGIDSIDLEAAASMNVKICNSPGAFDIAVGEIAVGYVLALTRGIVSTHLEVAAGAWPKIEYKSLDKMVVGILGFGAIGQGFFHRIKGFGAQVIATDPYYTKPIGGMRLVNFDELLSDSDVLVITCPLTSETNKLLDERALKNLKRGSFVVNVSRGPIIDEYSLVAALRSGQVAGAALDVFEQEPLPLQSDLRKLPVILGSHNANNTTSAISFVHENTISQLINHLHAMNIY